MNSYVFNAEKSFIAACFWQDMLPTTASDESTQLQRIGDTRSGETPWADEGWLHADADNYTSQNPRRPEVLVRRKFATQFWFGCYETAGEYDYEVRAASVERWARQWSHYNHRLDVSRNGYLGLYAASELAGHDPLASGSMLWRLEGFDPDGLSANTRHDSIELLSLHGKRIKRLREEGFAYLNEARGEDGWLALRVLRTGVAAP